MDPRSYWIGLGWVFTECSLGTDQCGSSDGLSPPQFHTAAALDSTPAVCAGRPPRRQAAPAGLPDVRAPRRPPYPPFVPAALPAVRAGRPPPSTTPRTTAGSSSLARYPSLPDLASSSFLSLSNHRSVCVSPQSDLHPLILISLGISRFSPFRF